MTKPSWGFIGCGNLAQALIQGALNEKILSPNQIFISGRTPAKLDLFRKKTGVTIGKSNSEILQKCDVIVLGTKPQDLMIPLQEISGLLNSKHLVISLAAGVTGPLLLKYLSKADMVVRVMANTPAMIQKGLFGIYFVQKKSLRASLVTDFFSQLGEITIVKNDKAIDAITSASASGTGFVMLFMEEFEKWLGKKGFEATEARKIVLETFSGSAELAKASPEVPLEELRNRITSKKGTTFEGLRALKKSKVGASLKSGLDAAFRRSGELAKKISDKS